MPSLDKPCATSWRTPELGTYGRASCVQTQGWGGGGVGGGVGQGGGGGSMRCVRSTSYNTCNHHLE